MPELTHLDDIRDRYAIERARRLRAEPNKHYAYLEHADDPWMPPVARPAMHDEVDVVVVGAGLSGLCCAVMLRKAGLKRIRLVDRAGDFGGTWYWNRYPAAQCDIESYIYLPFLEDMQYTPSAKYVYQPEILKHCQSVATKFDLYRDACFQTDVLELAWNDVDARWTVLTDRGDAFRTQFLVVAGGFLQRPKLPDFPGLGSFRGRIFHSSRWDYNYTGGEPSHDGGGLPGLRDARVGLVGTGASGLQLVTPVAKAARHLTVFQRTPVVVLPRNNQLTDEEWASSREPGWQRSRIEAFNRRGNAILNEPDPVQDGWTEVVFPVMASHGRGLFGDAEQRQQAELVDLQAMDAVRRRVSELVNDPEVAAKLMPYFRMLCKRPSFHDEYLQSFNRDNVTLVDIRGGIDRITSDSVVVGDNEYPVDCLILATGFDTSRGLLKSWGVDLVGRDGVLLTEYWGGGMRTFQGMHSRNFPNCFFHSTTQNAGPPNYTSSALEISEHIAYTIATARARGYQRIETTPDAEETWVQMIKAFIPDTHTEFLRNCTPGFYNNYGDIEGKRRLGATNFLGGSLLFYDMLRKWRAEDDLTGLELR